MYKKVSDILRLKVIKTIEGHNLLNGANRVMVGFSGGADSSVLLDVLLSLRKDTALRCLRCISTIK